MFKIEQGLHGKGRVGHWELGIRSVNFELAHEDGGTFRFKGIKNILPMNVIATKTEKDYRDALKRIDELIALDPKEGTDVFNELDLISTLVESHENEHYHMD